MGYVGVDVDSLPNFCGHEHWGSFAAIGMAPEGYRADVEPGAAPTRRASVWDIALDPYLGGWVASAGVEAGALARAAGADDMVSWWRRCPEEAMAALTPCLRAQELTGAFQCIRRGIVRLHGVDLKTMRVDDWARADEAVGSAYGDVFGWYRKAMKEVRFSELLRPVQPEFYFAPHTARAADEATFTRSLLRIDPLLEFWRSDCPRRDRLAALVQVDPGDAASWRAFIGRLLDACAERAGLGVKQLQAYSRALDFAPRSDAEVHWRGALSRAEVVAFQDWVMHECCAQAHERRWTHQVHVGTHNLRQSSPLPLEALARRYPQMRLVMLHSWPFLEEAGWLLKHVPNVYADTCWQAALNPEFLRQTFARWLNYVPANKIMLSHDSTSVEMAVGSSLFTREILAQALAHQGTTLNISEDRLRGLAAGFLHNNAVRVYGVGEPTACAA